MKLEILNKAEKYEPIIRLCLVQLNEKTIRLEVTYPNGQTDVIFTFYIQGSEKIQTNRHIVDEEYFETDEHGFVTW